MYDSKPFHNSLGNYDLIHRDHFLLNVSTINNTVCIETNFYKDSPFLDSYKNLPSHFFDIFNVWQNAREQNIECFDDKFWLIRFIFLMGTHFAAMLPFHFKNCENDSYGSQKKAIAIYCEGVKWLNLTYEGLNRNTKEFLNIPIILE